MRLLNRGADLHEGLLVRFTDTLGGPGLTSPGDSTDVWLELAPDRYAVVCWKGDHLRQGMAHDFEVARPAGRRRSPPPVADITLRLVDHSYVLEGPLTAGPHVIRIENRGQQPHEADIFRLANGWRPDDYVAWLDGGERRQPPVDPVGGVGDLAPGREVWLAVKLTPGRYFIVCQVPDAKDKLPHHRHGMLREFEVIR